MNTKITIDKLLKRFPNGFSVAPTGEIFEVLATSKDPRNLPLLKRPGGFMAVGVPDYQDGDEKFIGEKDAERLSVAENNQT